MAFFLSLREYIKGRNFKVETTEALWLLKEKFKRIFFTGTAITYATFPRLILLEMIENVATSALPVVIPVEALKQQWGMERNPFLIKFRMSCWNKFANEATEIFAPSQQQIVL